MRKGDMDKYVSELIARGLVSIVKIQSDTTLSPQKKEEQIQQVAETMAGNVRELIPSTPVYRIIVIALAVVSFTALVGAIVLVALEKTPIDAVIAVGSAAVGALAGTLIPQKQT